MVPYMNVGYEYDSFGILTTKEDHMPRIFIYKDNRYHLMDKYNEFNNRIFDNKYELKIWMNLNGYTIYRAYIYALSIIDEKYYIDNIKCQLFLSRK